MTSDRGGRWAGLSVLLCVTVAGCGAGPPHGEVEGTVRRDGKPLANVLVVFVPDPDRATPGGRAAGQTDAQGRYRVRADAGRDGAPVGWHRVVAEDLAILNAPRAPDGTVTRKPPVRFPPRYGDPLQTPLRKEVQSG